MTSDLYDFTVACWVKLDATDGAPHIFDFGTGTTRYMYLTPRNSDGVVRFGITTNGAASEVRVDGGAAPPTGRWTHVAVMKSALVVTLFVNGVPVGQNPNVGRYPARLGNTPNNWFGRSQSATTPFLVVNDFIKHVNDLRGDGVLTADQATFLIASAHAITAHILE